MTDKKMFFWTLSVNRTNLFGVGVSAMVISDDYFFSTQDKLDRWRAKNPDLAKDARWGMFEISVKCAKELIKLSKKKIRDRCYE